MKKILCCLLIIAVPQITWAITVRSFSDMPEDSQLIVFDWNQSVENLRVNTFANHGIDIGVPGSFLLFAYSAMHNTDSTVAPFDSSIMATDVVTFIFCEPVYSFGATFITAKHAGQAPFGSWMKNSSTKITAYDINGKVIETVNSSSYGNVVGPVEMHRTPAVYRFDKAEFMASFAGFWTDVPIYRVTFTNLSDSQNRSGWGSVAFSKNPRIVQTVAEAKNSKPSNDDKQADTIQAISADNDARDTWTSILDTLLAHDDGRTLAKGK